MQNLPRSVTAAACIVVLAACASTTLPTAVGVTRAQSVWAPTSPIDSYAVQQYAEEMARVQREGRLNADADLAQRVRVIAARVHAQVGAFKPAAVSWGWEVNVVASEEINAYGRAGGKIFVTSEMVSRLALTDAEIAFVLGHETAHALREHTREKVSYAALMAGLKQLGNKDSTKLSNPYEPYPHPAEPEMEIEADLIGMELAARASYDPRGALSFIDKLQRNGGTTKHAFAGSHPDYELRKRRLREKIDALAGLSNEKR